MGGKTLFWCRTLKLQVKPQLALNYPHMTQRAEGGPRLNLQTCCVHFLGLSLSQVCQRHQEFKAHVTDTGLIMSFDPGPAEILFFSFCPLLWWTQSLIYWAGTESQTKQRQWLKADCETEGVKRVFLIAGKAKIGEWHANTLFRVAVHLPTTLCRITLISIVFTAFVLLWNFLFFVFLLVIVCFLTKL